MIHKSGNILSKDAFESDADFLKSKEFTAMLDRSDKLLPPGSFLGVIDGYFDVLGTTFTSTSPTTVLGNLKSKKYNEIYVIADGSVCSDSRSIYYNTTIPKLNDERFLMGVDVGVGTASGTNFLSEHDHTNNVQAVLEMASTSNFYHSHTSSIATTYDYIWGVLLGGVSAGKWGTHRLRVAYLGFGGHNWLDPYPFISDDHDNHTSGQASTTANAGQAHNDFYWLPYSSPAISVPNHDHVVTLSPLSTIGTGVTPSLTDNRPQFMSCLYLFKVL